MEKDDEVRGEGNHIDFGARGYDPRVARWLTRDKVVKPHLSSYIFGRNNPIIFIDPDGNDDYYFDFDTKASFVLRTGAPHRFYVMGNTAVEGGTVSVPIGQISGNQIGELLYNNNKVFQDALSNASSGEEAQALFNARMKYGRDKYAGLVWGPVALAVAAKYGGFLLVEGLESLIEELSGIPVVPLNPDPTDILDPLINKEIKKQVTKNAIKNNGGKLVEYGGKKVSVYRGGTSFQLKPGEFKINKETGLVKTTHGVSLDVDANTVAKFGGAYKIESIPEGLKIIQRGKRAEHFEIVPTKEISVEKFQSLLNKVKVVPNN